MKPICTPEEVEAIKERHAAASQPIAPGDRLKEIDMVYSGHGRRAHKDRASLLSYIEGLERELAEHRVLAVRGSHDAPGFDACVNGEIETIRSLKSTANREG